MTQTNVTKWVIEDSLVLEGLLKHRLNHNATQVNFRCVRYNGFAN